MTTQPPTNTWSRREQQLRTAERAIAMLEKRNDELEARAERAELMVEALERQIAAIRERELLDVIGIIV